MKYATFIFLALLLPVSNAASDRVETPLPSSVGSICIGPNLMKAPYTEDERVTLTIDDGAPIDFVSQGKGVRLAHSGLNLEKKHLVKVYWRTTLTHSFEIDLRSFESGGAQIWRSPGYWKTSDICSEECAPVVSCGKEVKSRGRK